MNFPLSISIGGRLFPFDRPKVMGIINVTPDSFYAGSRADSEAILRDKIKSYLEGGVDIFDIGGCSTRPGADEVSAAEEYRRLAPALEMIRDEAPDIPVSVDTWRAEVARKCVENFNIDIINDISGGTMDEDMWAVVAELKKAYVLMHMRGIPATMQQLTDYDDVSAEVLQDLAFKTASLRQLGVADIIIDPGFGFAKDTDQNFRLLADLKAFREIGTPLLVGISRKTMIWKTLGITPDEAGNGTTVLNTIALLNGADILRVHDVKAAVEAVKLTEALKRNSTHSL